MSIFTIGDVVRLTGAAPHQVEYALRSRAIQPICRAGSANLYDRAGVDRIETALGEIRESNGRRAARKAQPAAAVA